MTKRRFWMAPLSALIIIALLALGGWAIHRATWSQGYVMGQLAAGGEGGALLPYAPYVPHGFGRPPLLLTIGLIVLLLIVIGKIFRFWAWSRFAEPRMAAARHWKMATGPHGEHWAKHWHEHHGHMPPWCWDWKGLAEEPVEEKVEETEPEEAAETVEAQ